MNFLKIHRYYLDCLILGNVRQRFRDGAGARTYWHMEAIVSPDIFRDCERYNLFSPRRGFPALAKRTSRRAGREAGVLPAGFPRKEIGDGAGFAAEAASRAGL